MNDVRKMIYGGIIGLGVFVCLMLSVVYVSSCGLTLTCHQAPPKGTPIPTLIPVSHSESQTEETGVAEFNKCEVGATDLIGAWVSAGAPETEPFPFTDVKGQSCEGTYAADIQHLFVENSLWHTGEIGCVSCHNAEKTDRNAGLDLTTYAAISSSDILGNGNWEGSKLQTILTTQGLVPAGHSADVPVNNPVLYAGSQVAEVEATPAP